jgi:MFS family permease
MAVETGVTGSAEAAARPSIRLWYMAGVLCLVNAIGFVDRQSLPLLVLQIEHDLKLSDTEMSLAIGLAFILVFSGMALPAGMLVDWVNRRRLVAGAVALFGASTIACAGAFSFSTLFIGRMVVGIGESVTGPGAIAMIKDAFPPAWQAGGIAVWAMGASIGSAMALLGGGAVLALVRDAAVVHVSVIGALATWKLVLIISGLATFPIAFLVWTVREPPRRHAATAGARGLGEAIAYVRREWRIYAPLFLVNGVTIMMGIGFGIWMPALLGRVWHLSRPEIGFHYGLLFLLFSPTSQFLAGFLVDKLERIGVARAIPIFGIIVGILDFLPAIFAPIASSLAWTWVLVAIYTLLTTSFFTIGTAFVARLTPGNMVGKVASLHLFSVGICGTAIAPTLIAAVSDHFFSGPAALGHAMSIVCASLDVVAIVCYVILLRVMRREG